MSPTKAFFGEVDERLRHHRVDLYLRPQDEWCLLAQAPAAHPTFGGVGTLIPYDADFSGPRLLENTVADLEAQMRVARAREPGGLIIQIKEDHLARMKIAPPPEMPWSNVTLGAADIRFFDNAFTMLREQLKQYR